MHRMTHRSSGKPNHNLGAGHTANRSRTWTAASGTRTTTAGQATGCRTRRTRMRRRSGDAPRGQRNGSTRSARRSRRSTPARWLSRQLLMRLIAGSRARGVGVSSSPTGWRGTSRCVRRCTTGRNRVVYSTRPRPRSRSPSRTAARASRPRRAVRRGTLLRQRGGPKPLARYIAAVSSRRGIPDDAQGRGRRVDGSLRPPVHLNGCAEG
mmetsp:Transcript_39758/g.90129  ORF Transcript_39758/g.90129 Transcript_39758/m.90129 type:complete len:209 (+) Transcript_39758:583-1209(+)